MSITFSDKDIRKVIQFATANGFNVKRTGKHAKLRKGSQTVTVSTSPSCPYGYVNAMRDIKKALKTLTQGHINE